MSHGSPGTDAIYGLMAEFDNPTDLVAAANRARMSGEPCAIRINFECDMYNRCLGAVYGDLS